MTSLGDDGNPTSTPTSDAASSDGEVGGVTLLSIGLTTGFGVIVFVSCIIVLGITTKYQMVEVAPRCLARPKETIYNENATGLYACQNRGNPFWGWMKWCMSLSYETLLTGVPGTGTRNKGLDGKMLRINLDHIVLLRFHAICYRVAVLTTFLCITIILPLYYTTPCPKPTTTDICRDDINNATSCTIFCNETQHLTDYEQTTLANVPQLDAALCGSDRDIYVGPGRCIVIRWRLVGVVLCFWIVYYYTCKIIYEEWEFLTTIRRAFYMEADHWQNRKQELEMTMLNDAIDEDQERESNDDIESISNTNNSNKQWKDPWIPHPELRETTVNIDLYSVLVGRVPSPQDEEEAALLSETDWQTKAATAFFDYCVPNQPGFSSSVAAITILPNAPSLARTWKQFAAAAAAMRKLRFIRKVISEKTTSNINSSSNNNNNNNGSSSSDNNTNGKKKNNDDSTNNSTTGILIPTKEDTMPLEGSLASDTETPNKKAHSDISGKRSQFSSSKRKKARSAYQSSARNLKYYRDVIGIEGLLTSDEGSSFLDEENHDTLGPEQTAILSRELAQFGAGCCPNGNEWRVRRASLDQLRKMELDAIDNFNDACEDLRQAQVAAASRGAMFVNKDGEVELSQRGSKHEEESSNSPIKLADVSEERSSGGSDCNPVRNEEHGIGNDFYSGSNATTRKMGSTEETRINPVVTEEVKEEEDVEDTPFLTEIIGLSSPTERTKQRQAADQQTVTAFNGSWGFRGFSSFFEKTGVKAIGGVVTAAGKKTTMWAGRKTKHSVSFAASKTKGIAGELVKEVHEGYLKESTYAIVTFTSRQAAVAARQCLLDGRGADEWIPVRSLPVPPLADAPPGVISGRTCCRPVTLTIPDKTKRIRRYCVYMGLPIFYFFYTLPLAATQSWINPTNWQNIAPGLKKVLDENAFLNSVLTGYLPAQVFTIFIAVLPQIFKLIANFGSNAKSQVEAEFSALKYYWYFMILSAFWGSSVGNFAIAAWNNVQGSQSDSEDYDFTTVLKTLALAIPTTTSATWLNWTIIKTLMTLPLYYMIFLNSFLFRCLGLKCLARANMGGGPGGPVSYRIYVDSGVVFMALVALAPAAPLMAPFALLYFLYIQPLLRRNLIFVYRPMFDGGGLRWPFLADMLISSLITGQVMLTVMMALKQALAPAVMAAMPIVPTLFFHWDAQKRFLRAYRDAALVQTGVLDMWDENEETSAERREEFRRFLVDAHRAAYIPACMIGNASAALTREPAIVVPRETDVCYEERQTRRSLHQQGVSTRRISSKVYTQVV